MVVEELIARLGWDLTGEEDLKRFKRGMGEAEKGLAQFAARAGALAATAGAAVATAMGAFGKSVISTSSMFEGFETSLITIEGSAEKARESMDWIGKFAIKTPYELQGITAAFVKLKSYGIDPMNGVLETLGDTASAMNKPLDMAVEAFADASTFQFERLREFGLVASQKGDEVTFQWTKNGEKLTRVVKKDGAEIQKFMLEHFGSSFSGAMLRQSKTWSGMVSNLGDAWTFFQKRVGDKGFFETVKGKLADLLDYIGRLGDNGTLDRWATNLSNAFTYASDVVASLVDRIGKNIGTIGKIIDENKGMWEWLKWVLGIIAIRMFPVAAFFAAAAFALDDFLTHLRGGESVLGNFIQWMADFLGADPGSVEAALAGIAAGAAGLLVASLGIGAFTFALSPLTKALLAFVGAYKAAKAGFEWLSENLGVKNAEIAATTAKPNPKAAPGYIEQSGTDENGEFIYMQGNRRVDRPAPNPTAGFTDEALDYKFMLQNLEANAAKMRGGNAAAAVNSTVNDNSDKSVSVTVHQTVTQATQAPGAAAQATGSAVAGAAKSGLPPTRMTGTGAF